MGSRAGAPPNCRTNANNALSLDMASFSGRHIALLLLSCSLATLIRQTSCSYEAQCGNQSRVFFNATEDYKWFPNSSQISPSEYDYFISELNFDAITGGIVIGAADTLYLLDTELRLLRNLTWETDSSLLSMCTDSTGYACRNHIRVYKRIPEDQSRLLVCGTQGAVMPQCRIVDIAGGTLGDFSVPVTASGGIVSYYPEFPGFGEFRASSNSDSTYFTAGFFGGSFGVGRHFSLSFQDVNFVTPSDPDTLQTTEQFRTIANNDTWLRFPVTFVDYYRADYPVVFPATLQEHYQFYFVFLRENLFDASASATIYSRVVRICRNDPGILTDPMTGARHFTTYLKARIYCEREVPTGREFVAALDYQYNDMRSMVFNEDGRYHENGMWVKTMYGAFSGPEIGPAGSAVCAYRADNSFMPTTGDGGFNEGIFDIFRADVQVGAAEEQNTFVECDPAGRDATDSEKVLIVQDVNQIGEDPLLVFEDFYIVQMTLDRVCVVRSQNMTECVNQDVLFLGTDTGKVMKVVFGSDESGGIVPVVAEEIALEDSSTINRMNIEEVDSTKYLFVTTSSRIYRLPLQRCSRFTDCSECVGSRDPYCVWNSAGLSCDESPLSAVDDMTGTVSADLTQNIHTGEVPSVCDYPEFGLSALSYQVTEGTGSVDVVVTATTPGLLGYVTLRTENGNATAGTDYVLRDEPVNFSAGQNESVITIGILDDSTYEGDEVFVVRLVDARVGGVTITQNEAEVVIEDDDVVTMEFASSTLNVSESDCYANVTVVKLGSTTSSVRVTLATGAGTASAGEDYAYIEVEVNFTPEDDSQTVLVPLVNDQVNEPTEYFNLTLMLPPGQPGAQLGGDTTTLTVMDDDIVTVQLAGSDFSVTEGSSSVSVQVAKSGQTVASYSVLLLTVDGSATAPEDYTHLTGGEQITFAPGDYLKTVNISISDDNSLESTESLTVLLAPTSVDQIGLQIGEPGMAAVTITDDDSVTVEFELALYNVSESSPYVEVTVLKQGLSDVNVTVLLSAVDGTAIAPGDYLRTNEAELMFGPAVDRIVYQIPIVRDDVLEAEENFTVHLSLPITESGVVLGKASATVVVTDDDSVTIGFESSGCGAADESGDLARFTLVMNGSSTIPVSVWFSTSNGTATASDDFIAQSNQQVTFEPGSSLQTVDVEVVNDEVLESAEYFFGTIMSSSIQVLLGQTMISVNITDDDSVTFGFSTGVYNVSEDSGAVVIAVDKQTSADISTSVQLKTMDGSATAPSDYTTSETELIFEPTEVTKMWTVLIVNDNVLEPSKFFYGRLAPSTSSQGIVLLDRDATVVSITDDDEVRVGFGAPNYLAREGDGLANITVIRDGSSTESVVILLSIENVNATGDYGSIATEICFQPGTSEQTLVVPILNDDIHEPTESFLARLSLSAGQTGVLLDRDMAIVSIEDDDVVTIEFQSVVYSVSEGSGSVGIVVAKRGSTTSDIVVEFSTTNVSASAPEDYNSIQNMLTFQANETEKTVVVQILDDNVLESDEVFMAVLSLPTTPRVLLGLNSTSVVITDDDTITVEIAATQYNVSEAEGSATITIRKNSLAAIPVSITLTTIDGSAVAPDDYTASASDVLTLSPGMSELTVMIPLTNDNVHEFLESFSVAIGLLCNQSGVLLGQSLATVLITDDDTTTVGLEMAEYNVSEASGSVSVRVSKMDISAVAVTVLFNTVDQTATAQNDYSSVTTEICFSADTTEQTVIVPVFNDDLHESTESFLARLSLPDGQTGVLIDRDTTTVTIEDDDVVTIEFQSMVYSVSEGSGSVDIVVAKRGFSTSDIVVEFSTTNASALAPEDYNSTQIMLTFQASETDKTVVVQIVDDNVLESDEVFMAELSLPATPRVLLGLNSTSIVITDDDTITVEITATQYNVSEAEGSATITIRRNALAAIPIGITLTTIGGSAVAPDDYAASASDVLTLSPGMSELTVMIPLVNDNVHEFLESFSVAIGLSCNQSGVLLGQSLATVLITDDDTTTLGLEMAEYNVSEAGGSVSVRVSKMNTSAVAVTLLFNTVDQTATAQNDYSSVTTEICFSTDATDQTVIVPVLNDDLHESMESFLARLSLPAGQTGVLLDRDTTTVTIEDDDVVTVGFQLPAAYSVTESDESVNITIVKQGSTTATITVNFTTVDGAATAPGDFVATQTQIALQPSESEKSIIVPLVDDTTVESTESFTGILTLITNQARVRLGEDSVSVTVIDDDAITVEITATQYNVSEAEGSATFTIRTSTLAAIPISVTLTTIDGSAVAPDDYTASVSDVFTLSPGMSELTVMIPLTNDNVHEFLESFSVAIGLSCNQSGVLLGQSLATVLITDDDTTTLELEMAEYNVSEAGGSVSVRVSKMDTSAVAVTVLFNTVDQTATAQNDYSSVTNEICFSPGTSEQTVVVPILNDDLRELTESFLARLSLPAGQTGVLLNQDTTTVTIEDDDVVTIEFQSVVYSVSEGSRSVSIVVVKRGFTSSAIDVEFSTTNASASAPEDYNSTQIMLTFQASETEKTVVVQIMDDNVLESEEEFMAELSLPATPRVLLGLNSTSIVITDDDRVIVGFQNLEHTVSESDGFVNVTVRKVGVSAVPFSVSLTTTNGDAVAPNDYTAIQRELQFDPDDSAQTAMILIQNDVVLELAESFAVDLRISTYPMGLQLSQFNRTTVTITDNDSIQVGFQPTLYNVSEADCVVGITVVKTGNAAIPVVISFNTSDDTALAQEDYVGVAQREISFAPSDTEQMVQVVLVNDAATESVESFLARLLLPDGQTGVQLLQAMASITINDDDNEIQPCPTQLPTGTTGTVDQTTMPSSSTTVSSTSTPTSSMGPTLPSTGTTGTVVETTMPSSSTTSSMGPTQSPTGTTGTVDETTMPSSSTTASSTSSMGPTQSPTGSTSTVDETSDSTTSTSASSTGSTTETDPLTVSTAQNLGDCLTFGSDSVVAAILAVLIAIIVILVLVVIVLACVLAKKQRSAQIKFIRPPKVLGEEPSGNKLGDLTFGLRNVMYEVAETQSQTTTPAACETKTLATLKTSSEMDEQSAEKDLGAAADQLESENELGSGQLVDQYESTKL